MIRGPAINFTLTYPADWYDIFIVILMMSRCHSMTFSWYVMTVWHYVMTFVTQTFPQVKSSQVMYTFFCMLPEAGYNYLFCFQFAFFQQCLYDFLFFPFCLSLHFIFSLLFHVFGNFLDFSEFPMIIIPFTIVYLILIAAKKLILFFILPKFSAHLKPNSKYVLFIITDRLFLG